ncbi:MAG: hypothetical protein RL458_1388 [Pseudomonadota bacterium]
MRLVSTRGSAVQLIGALLRRGEVKLSFVERAPKDGALDTFVLDPAKAVDVLDAGNTARGDHRHLERLREPHRGLDIDAGEHAVATDVGIDHAFHAVVFEFASEVHHIMLGEFAPAVGGHAAVLCVEPDDDLAGERATGIMQEPRILTAAVPMIT